VSVEDFIPDLEPQIMEAYQQYAEEPAKDTVLILSPVHDVEKKLKNVRRHSFLFIAWFVTQNNFFYCCTVHVVAFICLPCRVLSKEISKAVGNSKNESIH
jgi:hypothetical protein